MKLLQKLRCMMRPVHEPLVRQALGGWRCAKCNTAGADLDDMGYLGEGYTSPLRKLFSRANGGSITRTSWEEKN